MPELPEIETIVRHLQKRIRGKRIIGFASDTPRIFRDHKSFGEVKKQVVGKKIKSVERIGKNIIFRLTGGICLVIHLMMTGKILINPKDSEKHIRFSLRLSGGINLVLSDIRKFGRCRIVEDPKILGGEDALNIKFERFKSLVQSRKKILKNFLLDQSVIAGIGNIYGDEILWQAGIHPLRKTNHLKENEVKSLYWAIKKVLALAVKKGGTSSHDYRKPDGTKGGYYKIRRVYQRTGEECKRDGVIIKRMMLAGRATHFCPKHQC